MNECLQKLQEALPGLTDDMPREFRRLAEIFLYNAFELSRQQEPKGGEIFRIPYMMNDAVEAWLTLENCRIAGTYSEDQETGEEYGKEDTSGQLVMRGTDYGLIVKQGSAAFTLWFSGISWKMTCYQYHRIGHFWVSGQEPWRRLVYMLGTVYDKYGYLGEAACSSQEMELLQLMEFPPFRHWSPIKESLDDWYITDPRGARLAGQLARETGDIWMERRIRGYLRFPCRLTQRIVERAMEGHKGQKLYEEIRRRVWEASGRYPERDYGQEGNERIRKQREQVHQKLTAWGFSGEYPEYRRGDMRIEAAEEHPFTCMEAENFSFRIRFLVSEGCKDSDGYCGGFFRKGKGRIEDSLAFLEEADQR